MEVDSVSPKEQEQPVQIDSADVLVAVVAGMGAEGVDALLDVLKTLPGSPKTIVLHNGATDQLSVPARDTVNDPAKSDSGDLATAAVTEKSSSLFVMPWPTPAGGDLDKPIERISAAYEAAFLTAEKLGAKVCCLIASTLDGGSFDWCCQLIRASLEAELDLVAPYYAAHKFGGLLNSSIIYPVTRCLYGRRIRNPMGPDLVVSRRLYQKLIGAGNNTGRYRLHPLASTAPIVVCENFTAGQVNIGSRVYPPTDWMNLSSLVAQVLDPVFQEMSRSVACWQKTRGSVSIPSFGNPISVPEETAKVDVSEMIESFRLGNRDLREIWGVVLPPATSLELSKLARVPAEQFRMPDELWVRIIYDFALAHRLQTINRDHLLRSMTPLYLAWVASYAREMETAGAAAVEQRIERLCLAYESGKPYFISRWRWPDRFNP